MEVIKSGLEHVKGGGCPCICSSGWATADTMGLEAGACGYNCGCSYVSFTENAEANSMMAYNIFFPED